MTMDILVRVSTHNCDIQLPTNQTQYHIILRISGECGHIIVPDGVNLPEIANVGGLRKAVLSCAENGHVFAGEKDPTPQYCIRGQWTYQKEGYDIPSCQGEIFSALKFTKS